jgi:hypothetical protein
MAPDRPCWTEPRVRGDYGDCMPDAGGVARMACCQAQEREKFMVEGKKGRGNKGRTGFWNAGKSTPLFGTSLRLLLRRPFSFSPVARTAAVVGKCQNSNFVGDNDIENRVSEVLHDQPAFPVMPSCTQ